MRNASILGLLMILSTALSTPGAQEKSADEIAQELANPTNALGSMASNFDFRQFEGNLPGADNQDGFSYLFQPSRTPLKFQVQYWHYVESPDNFGPDWQLRFNFTPVINLPWGKK